MPLQFLHVMIRVLDLDASLRFYTEYLGMRLLRRRDYPEGRFTLAFVGYGDESDHTVLELTYNWDQSLPYENGNAFGHLALGIDDIYTICDTLRNYGVRVVRDPGPMKHGSTVIAFIEDPDGHRIELIQRA